jgi:ribulose-bisphosphate carboxylase large chain
VSGDRFTASYVLLGPVDEARRRVEDICVEQTIEFPADLLADDHVSHHIIGRVEELAGIGPGEVLARISYAVETAGFELPQLVNVLFGNTSLQKGVRLVGFELPESLLSRFRGPRFGPAGLRRLFDAGDRALLATAIKPMGLPVADLADLAYRLALGGIDLIKDDHGLADQPFSPFRERVARCAEAVRRANERSRGHTIYVPSVNAPYHLLEERVAYAVEVGAGGLMALPGITGFDHLRRLAEDDTIGLPLVSHPALLGSFVSAGPGGIDHGVLFGKIMRLVGADISIFPNHGGRFTFSPEACHTIAEACRAPMGRLAAALPSPGGGMTRQRVGEMVAFYGRDVMLLIGGDLHRGGDLTEAARAFREAAGG